MGDKTVPYIRSKTVPESKLATYVPKDGEILVVKKTSGGGAFLRVGDGVTAGGVDPVSHIMSVLNSSDTSLDTLVEIVAYLKSVRTDLTNVAPAWAVIQNKPTTLSGYGITDAASASHTHTTSQVVGLNTALDAKENIFDGIVASPII
jgi:hypothetical protein